MKVSTVLGEIECKDMGYTLLHEHIMIADHTMRKVYPNWINIEEFVDYAKRYIARAKRYGVKTIVDVTPFQLGRDAEILRRVSEEAEINVIAATGYFWSREICFVDKSPEFLAKVLIDDIRKGMEGTDIKASIIKCGTSGDGMTEQEKRLFKATVIAHKETGVPITTHSASRAGAIAQMDCFDELGADPKKIVIGHVGDFDDPRFLEYVANRGYYIGEDRIGVDKRHPDQLDSDIRVDNIIELWKRGYLDKIVLSHDASIFIDYWEGRENLGCPWDMVREFDVEKLQFQFGFISETIVPKLKEAGMSDEDINTMLVSTPQKLFER